MAGTEDRAEDLAAIRRLNDDFGYLVDHGEVARLVALFTADVLYTNGPRRLEGREAVERFFRERTARGPRTSRHFYSGLRVAFHGADLASGYSVWLTFAAPGLPPIESAVPYLVADILDVYRRTEEGWRFAERRIAPVFVNPAVPPPGESLPPPTG